MRLKFIGVGLYLLRKICSIQKRSCCIIPPHHALGASAQTIDSKKSVIRKYTAVHRVLPFRIRLGNQTLADHVPLSVKIGQNQIKPLYGADFDIICIGIYKTHPSQVRRHRFIQRLYLIGFQTGDVCGIVGCFPIRKRCDHRALLQLPCRRNRHNITVTVGFGGIGNPIPAVTAAEQQTEHHQRDNKKV